VKYRIDDWVIYKPFPNDQSKFLSEIEKRSLILWVFPKEDFYDYEIIIDGTGKIKKVREHQLFPIPDPTY
jgi:hypothetical protein